jgi:hypothetical protein
MFRGFPADHLNTHETCAGSHRPLPVAVGMQASHLVLFIVPKRNVEIIRRLR